MFVQAERKETKYREAHLNYYASADNRDRQPSHHKKTKLNNNTNQHSSLTKKYIERKMNTKLKPHLVASYDIQRGNKAGLF